MHYCSLHGIVSGLRAFVILSGIFDRNLSMWHTQAVSEIKEVFYGYTISQVPTSKGKWFGFMPQMLYNDAWSQ